MVQGFIEEFCTMSDFNAYDALIVAGGDGTIHELLNGLMTKLDHEQVLNSVVSLPLVGVLPSGTGNSLM